MNVRLPYSNLFVATFDVDLGPEVGGPMLGILPEDPSGDADPQFRHQYPFKSFQISRLISNSSPPSRIRVLAEIAAMGLVEVALGLARIFASP
jgi:hypothetical protein